MLLILDGWMYKEKLRRPCEGVLHWELIKKVDENNFQKN